MLIQIHDVFVFVLWFRIRFWYIEYDIIDDDDN